MSRIVISLSGEGRGHAARVYTLIEMLQDEHDLLILTPASLIPFFSQIVKPTSRVEFYELAGLKFHYDLAGRLSYVRSVLSALPFALNLSKLLEIVSNRVQRFAPDLAIVDFEPLLPRIARMLNIPSLSLDHQHFLSIVEPKVLPAKLRNRLRFLRTSVRIFCPRADRYLVSSFYRYAQRVGTESYRQVGVLLRQELLCGTTEAEDHFLVYVRRNCDFNWLQSLKHLPGPVHIYGLDQEGSDAQLHYHRISPVKFLNHLMRCSALITTAGNQLVGEALAMGKPVLAIPEVGNFEQQINGFFLNQTGMGESHTAADVSPKLLASFLDRLDAYRAETIHFTAIGNPIVKRVVNEMLGVPPRLAETALCADRLEEVAP